MVIEIKRDASKEEVGAVIKKLQELGFAPELDKNNVLRAPGGDFGFDPAIVKSLPGVLLVVTNQVLF
ncbi:MAG: hypothetical protein NT155_01410 [Candidatus Staskawiczbacteria bacterium]|nr:hypothetical protein [Candidatus Staskawiczbacteria bacterium]